MQGKQMYQLELGCSDGFLYGRQVVVLNGVR